MNSSATAGCFSIIKNNEGNILLVKRRDYPIWDLPGGRVDAGEVLEECAVREAEEETGCCIKIEAKIGEYHMSDENDIQHIYSAVQAGGELIAHGPETAQTGWFDPKQLPLLMVPNRKRQIRDFLSAEGMVKESIKTSYIVKFLRAVIRNK
ncbi:NUDIX hydrolase [Metabacillus indicus]|uniref:NUDIX hydrolase n=1 Tax=Metabacillus indicus TaxID=246786 RepID=UPI002A046859|nr:NUDIX hydrolase [Metabacillus indicus]MDX8291541.1 NUDIX hydrolase [Metabacillus indicus]